MRSSRSSRPHSTSPWWSVWCAASPSAPPAPTLYTACRQLSTRPTDPPARSLLPARRVEACQTILFEIRARAPAAGLANGAAAASSALGWPTPAAAAAIRRRPRVASFLVPHGPAQVPPARLPARHGRRALRRQAHGRRALRLRRRRRRRERCSRVAVWWCMCVHVGPGRLYLGSARFPAVLARRTNVFLIHVLMATRPPHTPDLRTRRPGASCPTAKTRP